MIEYQKKREYGYICAADFAKKQEIHEFEKDNFLRELKENIIQRWKQISQEDARSDQLSCFKDEAIFFFWFFTIE